VQVLRVPASVAKQRQPLLLPCGSVCVWQSFFSIAGAIMTVDRASLLSTTFERLCVMKGNEKFLPDHFVFDWLELNKLGVFSKL
jgi:hypothetical protein